MEAAAELEQLAAERQIGRQIVRFGRAMDDRDWSTLHEILLADATADLGTGMLEGSDTIIGLIRSYLEACGATQHLVGSMIIDVTGDVASSQTYVRDLHLGAKERQHLIFSTLGDYHDRWERHGTLWRIRHRKKINRGQVGTLEVFAMDGPTT